MNHIVKLNEGLSTNMVKNGNMKLLHSYAVVVYLTRGLGYMVKKDLVASICEFSGVGERTAWVYLRNLENAGLIFTKNTIHGSGPKTSTVHVRSKCKVAFESEFFSRKSIKFSVNDLRTYASFRDHYIRITHLNLQKSFRFAYQRIKRNTHSLLHMGEIDPDECPDSIDKVGCSIRKVCEYTNLSFQTVQKSLKGYTKATANLVATFGSYSEFMKTYTIEFFKKNRKYVFGKKNGKIYVFYLLGSVSAYYP